MDQIPLVETQIRNGRQLIDRLLAKAVPIAAAFWAKEGETDPWYLFLVTPLVGEDGATRAAYRRVNTLIHEMEQDGFWFDPLEIKVVSPQSAIAKAALDIQSHYPKKLPAFFPGHQFRGAYIELAYLYPPAAVAVR